MRLLRLEIENFGKLQGYKLELSDGLNTICEENGFGKSTVAAFIKAMLYGLPATTKRNLDKNERKKYTPWQGGAYGGSLEFESDLGRFRIERFFAAKEANDEFRLFDLATNKPSDAYSSQVGVELFGIDGEGFARSAFLSQNGMDNNEENVSVTAKLTGLLEDVNDMGSYDVAVEILEKRRRFYEVKGGRGRVSDLNTALSEGRRELDRLNDLLTQQKQYEARRAESKEQIAAAEQDLSQLREQLRLAELRQAHVSECERLRERIGQTEAQRRQILDAFRDRQIPDDRELADARRLLKEYRIEQNQCNELRLSPEEAEALERLQRRYPAGQPAPQQLSELTNAVRAEADATAALQAFPILQATADQQRFASSGIPTDASLEQARQKIGQADLLEQKIKESAQQKDGDHRQKMLRILGYTLLSVGFLGGVVAFLIPALRVMLLILGGITITVGGVLFLLSKKENTNLKHAETTARLEEQRNRLRAELCEHLERYGFSGNGDPRHALQELEAAAKRASQDAKRQEENEFRRRELRQIALEHRQRLQAQFACFGFSSLPNDPQSALLRIHTDLREWETLTQKADLLKEREKLIRTELTEKQERLSVFLNRLTRKETNQPEACLEQMEQLCRSYAITEGTIHQQQQDLLECEKRYAQTLPEETPSQIDLKLRERELNQRLDDLRRADAELLRGWSHCTEQTQKIPQLEDELSHLSAKLATAEKNLDLLRKTTQFLTESKEALSTRYLGGMQEHFTRFRRLAEGENAPDANIDTSFSISVRQFGKSRELESFSRGSRDVLQFCARLALTCSMFEEGEKPFLLLDDPFVNLDKAHFASVRGLLDQISEEFQILYLVCHPDRR